MSSVPLIYPYFYISVINSITCSNSLISTIFSPSVLPRGLYNIYIYILSNKILETINDYPPERKLTIETTSFMAALGA